MVARSVYIDDCQPLLPLSRLFYNPIGYTDACLMCLQYRRDLAFYFFFLLVRRLKVDSFIHTHTNTDTQTHRHTDTQTEHPLTLLKLGNLYKVSPTRLDSPPLVGFSFFFATVSRNRPSSAFVFSTAYYMGFKHV